MEQTKKLLKERKNQLQELKKDKEKALVKAPEGNLRLCKHGNKTQYYYRKNPKDLKWQLKFKEREVMQLTKLLLKIWRERMKDFYLGHKILCSHMM